MRDNLYRVRTAHLCRNSALRARQNVCCAHNGHAQLLQHLKRFRRHLLHAAALHTALDHELVQHARFFRRLYGLERRIAARRGHNQMHAVLLCALRRHFQRRNRVFRRHFFKYGHFEVPP